MVVITFYIIGASTIQFALLGLIRWLYVAWNAFFVFLGTIVGLVAIDKIIKKTGRVSIIVFLVAGLITLSAVVTPLLQVARLQNANPWGFSAPC